MNMTNQMFIDLLKAYSRKYTHRKKVFSSAKGKMVWRYYYKEHHGGGVTKVENLEVGDAFKVNYNGVEGHFDVKKVKGNMVTVVHSETGKETPLTKAELRAVLLKTHAKALKRNVKKKEDALARTKNKRSRERAQQRLNMAKRKIQGLEAEQEDNFETMPETEQEPQAQERSERLKAPVQEEMKSFHDALKKEGLKGLKLWIPKNAKLPRARVYMGQDGYIEFKERERGNETILDIDLLQLPDLSMKNLKAYIVGATKWSKERGYLDWTQEGVWGDAYTLATQDISNFSEKELAHLYFTARKRKSDYENAKFDFSRHNMNVLHANFIIKTIEEQYGGGWKTLEKLQFYIDSMPEQEPQAQAPKDARSSLVEQAEKVIQEVHDKHEDKPLVHKPLENFEIGEHTHTKTGEIAHTVKNKKRVSRSEFLEHKKKARELGGFYSKFTSKFHFKEKDKALEFAHHFEPVQDQAEEVKQDAKKEDHTHHENNFETMPEAHGDAEIIRTKNHYPFAVVLKNDTIDDLITRRLAYNKHKGQTTTYNQHLNDALNAQEYKKAKELRKDRFNVYNFETMAQAKAFVADMAQKEIKDNRTVNNSDKLVQHLKQAQEKITHEILENLGRLHSGDYQNFLEDADKKPRQRKFYSQDDFDLNIKITNHERKVTEGINFKIDKPATRRRKFQSGINNQAYDTVPFHELEASIDKKHLPLINQKVSPSKEPLKLRFEVRDNKKSFNQGKTVLGINIIDEDLFRYRGSKTSKYFDHIEIDPVTLEIRHNWTIQGFRQENEIRELKDFLDTEINKLLDVAMPNTKRLDQIRDREAKEVEKAGYEYETNSKPLTEHFEQKTRAYTTRSKQASARAKGLLKEDARPMIWDAEQGEMKQAPVDARKQMVQTAEAVQDNFETMPDVAPKRSNKEILEQYDTSDLKIQSSEDFGKLDPQSSLKRHDYRMSIYRNTEDKLKDIDGGIINTFSYHTHGTLQARARERYNLNKVKADLKPTQIVEDSFYLTGYNDSVTNEYIAVDDGINKLAQKYEYIDDVRENKDAILAELKQMAQSTYENRIRGFESSFETDYKKKEVEKFYRKDLENALKDKQKALERLKGKLPSSVHQALETEVKQGLEQHTKDVEVMINHYNTELDKIVDKEKTAYRTKGDIYNTIQANLPKYKNPHLQGMYTGEKKFEAKVQGRPHKKLIAKMFNEVMEQVAREKANEPTGLVQDNFETMPDAPTKPTNAREQMIQVAENVQDNFETMPEVDYESLNRGQKIKIQDKVYTVAVKRDRSFSSVGHAIQLNDENRKPAGILIFNDNGTVRFKDMKGLEDIKDLKEAQLITGNKEQSIKFKNDPREPLPKPTGGIISNMSRRREAQKQTSQPRKETPQKVSTTDQTNLDKRHLENVKRGLDIQLESAVQMGKIQRAQRNLPHPKEGVGEFHLTNQIDPRYMEALEKKMYRGFKSVVPNLHPQNVVKLDNMYYMNVAQVRADAQKQEDEYYKLFKVLINDKINKYTEAYHNIEILKKDIEDLIPYADTNGTEETRKAHQDYLLKVSKEALKQLKSVEATKGEAFNALKKTYFTAKKTGHAKQKALAEIANKAIDRVYQEIKDQPTSKPDVMYFVSMISKYTKPTNAREQMVQTAEAVQAPSAVKQTHNEILKDVAGSASDKLLEIVQKHYSYLRSYGKRDETDLQVSNERRMVRRINRMISKHLKAGDYDKATIDQLSDLNMDSPQMQVFIELLHDKALENKRQQREQAIETATQEPQNLQHTQADLNAISMRDFERAYYNQSHSAGERGRSKKREYVNTLNQFESLAQELIDLGADKAKVQQLAKQSAERYTNALKDELSSESKVASWFVVGRGGFNTRRQEKLRDYASNKRSKTIQVRNQAIKKFEKLRLSDPNSARATQEQRTQEALKELADWKKRAEDTRAKAKAESVVLPVNSSLPMTKQNFHSLKTGSRIKLTYKVDGKSKTEEFQVGRESHSKKKFTTTRKLHPIVDGKVDKTIDVSIRSTENHPYLGDFFRLSDDRTRIGSTEMQNFEVLPKIKKAYHKLNARELLLKALTA